MAMIMRPRQRLTKWCNEVLLQFFLVALLAWGAPVSKAQNSGYEITPADKEFLADVLAAVEKKDAAWIARHTLLPVAVGSGKERRMVKSEEEFRKVVARALTPEIAERMRTDAKEPLFKNWRGVMLGDGILWFTQRRASEKEPRRYVILAIGDFAFQPATENR
jgi:hypothetical protein